jgi:hypothetical protein
MSDFEKSDSNIFADLGDPEAEQTLVRAQILSRIRDFQRIKYPTKKNRKVFF